MEQSTKQAFIEETVELLADKLAEAGFTRRNIEYCIR